MKTTLEYYDIFPKILCTEREAEITIRPLGVHAAFDEKKKYRVKIKVMKRWMYNTATGICSFGIGLHRKNNM